MEQGNNILDLDMVRLLKYTRLIDRSIADKRYSLATQLAYRCVLEYYRLFIRLRIPGRSALRRNAFQLSLEVVQYLRLNPRRLHGMRAFKSMQMLSSTYFLTSLYGKLPGDRHLFIDRVIATYARDQSLAIANYLLVLIQKK